MIDRESSIEHSSTKAIGRLGAVLATEVVEVPDLLNRVDQRDAVDYRDQLDALVHQPRTPAAPDLHWLEEVLAQPSLAWAPVDST